MMKFVKILFKILPWLLIVNLLFNQFDQLMSNLVTQKMASGDAESQLWLLVALVSFVSLVLPLVAQYWALVQMVGVLGNSLAKDNQLSGNLTNVAANFIYRNPKYFVIENLRALGKVLLWALLLVVPGVVQFIGLVFTPFVVLLNPRYAEGGIDALETSIKIAKQNKGKLLFWFLMFVILLPLASTGLFDGKHSIIESPVWAVVGSLFDSVMMVSSLFFLWGVFVKSQGGNS